jgi:hypothetical protein
VVVVVVIVEPEGCADDGGGAETRWESGSEAQPARTRSALQPPTANVNFRAVRTKPAGDGDLLGFFIMR